MKKAGLYNLGSNDFIKGAIMAALTALCTALLQILENGSLPTLSDLKVAGIAALTAFIAYLMKNFLTNENDQFFKKGATTSIQIDTTNPDKPRPDQP